MLGYPAIAWECAAPRPRGPTGARPLAKKPNYDFEKRKKEQDRKKKKDAKREERLARKRDGTGGVEGDPDYEPADGDDDAADGGDGEDAADPK